MTNSGDEGHDYSVLYVEDEVDTRELVRGFRMFFRM